MLNDPSRKTGSPPRELRPSVRASDAPSTGPATKPTPEEAKKRPKEAKKRAGEALASLGLRSSIRSESGLQSHKKLEQLSQKETELLRSIEDAIRDDRKDVVERLHLELNVVQQKFVALRQQLSPPGNPGTEASERANTPRDKTPPTTPRGGWAANHGSVSSTVGRSGVTLSPGRRSQRSEAIGRATVDTSDIEASRISKLRPKMRELRRKIAELENGEQDAGTKAELEFLKKRLAVLDQVKSEDERSKGSFHLPHLSLLKDDNEVKQQKGTTLDSSRKKRSPLAHGVRSALRNTIHLGESVSSHSDVMAEPSGAKSARTESKRDKDLTHYKSLLSRRTPLEKQLRELELEIAEQAPNLGMPMPKLGLPPPKPRHPMPPLPNLGSSEQANSDSPQTARPRLETKTPPSSL